VVLVHAALLDTLPSAHATASVRAADLLISRPEGPLPDRPKS